jgi:predicted Zn-dependent peptidase
MEYVKVLKRKREEMMEKYASILRKPSLTEEEIMIKNEINQEIINIDLEIEEAKYQADLEGQM